MLLNQTGMGFQQGMQADPFTQILANPVQISMQNYPKVPDRVYPFRNPALSQLMIAQTAAAIQNYVNESPFHRWLFNMVSQNGWNNDYWRQIGQLSPWALHFYIIGTNYQGNNPESLIPNVCQVWVRNAAAMAFLDPTYSNYAKSMIQNDMNAMQQWAEQASILQQIMNLPNQAQGAMMNAGMTTMGGIGNMTNAQMAMSGVASGGGLFTQTPNVTQNIGAGGDAGGRFSRAREEPVKVQQQPSQQPKETQRQPKEAVVSQQQSNEFHEYGSEQCPDWYPNRNHPVLPAISLLTHKLTIVHDGDGLPGPLVQPREQNEMDYDQHVIPNNFGRIYRDASPAAIRAGLRIIEAGIEQADKDAKEVKDIDFTKDLTAEQLAMLADSTVDPDIRLVDDINIAWLVARASRSKIADVPCLHRTVSSLIRPMLVTKSMTSLIDNLADSATLSQLAARLKGAIPVSKEDESEDKMVVIEAVNQEITAAVNRALLMNLSFRTDQLSIESFMDDYEDLIAAMRDGVGERFVKALQDNEKEIIYSVFNTDLLSDEDISEYVDGLVGEFQGKMVGSVHLLSTAISTTLVRVRAHELNFQPFWKHSGAIIEDANPLLWKLAQSILGDDQKVIANRHLVQTIDGVTLEFTKSYLTGLPQVTVLK